MNAVARRKIALIFLLLFLFVLLLSPWASAPSPAVHSPVRPEAVDSAEPSIPPDDEAEPVRLKVAVPLSEAEFAYLQKKSDEQAFQYRDIEVELKRVEPREAYAAFRQASRIGESADVMLMPNEWVKTFAVSGYLMPADSAFVGDAMSEQFDALSSPLKWNGLFWGVPRDFDPPVLVWNLNVLRSIAGENAVPPQTLAQWAELASGSRTGPAPVAWLAMSGSDPASFLTWMQSASGERTDTVWTKKADPWSGTPLAHALELLVQERTGVFIAGDGEDVETALTDGRAASAVLPYSAAQKLIDEGAEMNRSGLLMDRSAWQLPFVWPQGRSYAISSSTEAEDAARRWIAAMTEPSVQLDNWETFGKLPVYRSLYQNGGALAALFKGAAASSFPYAAPADFGPELPSRLNGLESLWSDFAAGEIGLEEWNSRWNDGLSDFQLDD